jgi:hypothetical protein
MFHGGSPAPTQETAALMSTLRNRLLLALVALAGSALAAGPAQAGIYYVPSPDTGGVGRPETKVEMAPGGPRRLTPIFIPSGVNGATATGPSVRVDNDVKPNVFDVKNFINGPGMLKLVGDPGSTVRSSAMFLTLGSNGTAWALPVITSEDWFETTETAHIQGLARNAQGASNIEIMNLGAGAASCSVQILRPKGSPIGSPRSFPLPPISHFVLEDALNGVITGSGANVRAQVTCNQPFYAYGTFVSANPAAFRMLYPLSAAPTADVETITVNRGVNFFSPVPGNSAYNVELPLVPGRAYRRVTIDFDVNIRDFTPIFTGLVGMYHPGGPRFGKTLYFGTFIRGNRSRTLVDQGSPVIEPAIKFGTGWKEGATHHVMIVYDTEQGMLRFQASRNGSVISDYTGAAFNYDLADRGSPVRLTFGLSGIADGAYYPPVGWKFSNLHIVVTR